MKPRMYFWKGWIRFDPNPITQDLDWISKSKPDKNRKSYHYFLPNTITRAKFATDILPYMQDFEYINADLLYLRNFQLVPTKRWGNIPNLTNMIWFPHQVNALEYCLNRDVGCVYLGTGTGKTLIACGLIAALPATAKVLVLTPKKVIPDFKKAISKHLLNTYVVVTNYEQLNSSNATSLMQDWDMVILDESHKVKQFTSKTMQNLKMIMGNVKHCYLFTGTPQDKMRSEIFGQLSILDEKFMPTKTDFMQRYFYLDEYYAPTAEKLPEELDSMISEVCFGYRTEDVITLPTEKHRVLYYQVPDAYWKMTNKRIYREGGHTFIAETPATLRIRQRQICSGFCVSDEERICHIDAGSNSKIHALRKLMDAKRPETQCIIFTEFDWEQSAVSNVLNLKSISHGLVNGKINIHQSERNVKLFKDGDLDVLVIQSRSGGAGLNLQNCYHTIFFALPESSITFEQCKGRTRRMGQKAKNVFYYYLIGRGSIEQLDMIENLKIKETNRAELFNLFEGGNKIGKAET